MKTFHLTIAKVGENLFDGEVVSVSLPGIEGAFEILGGHEALVSELRHGDIRVATIDGDTHRFTVEDGGIAETSGNQVTILL
ncbi:MAG: F0F1 ATP synthase subunit epsilon [Candidatus Paceibacterota bacterium]|jgi:F-type H+-transporting ATPase subunit epsilon